MSIWSTIGQAIGTFCTAIWKGLQAVWGLVKKVFTTLLSWAGSILCWFGEVAASLIVGVVVAFIWIFGDDDELGPQGEPEDELGRKIGDALGKPHKKIVIKGVFNKQTGKVSEKTEIEATDVISSEVKQQTGCERFAELEAE